MSEWLDLQQNKHDSLKLHENTTLDEKIAAVLESDKFDRDDKKRLTKLGRIYTELRRGKNVQNRQLHRWLTSDEYEQFEQGWKEQQDLRHDLEKKPEAIVEYEKFLKQQIFRQNKSLSGRFKNSKGKRDKTLVEGDYIEAIHEYVDEMLERDPSLRRWLDREWMTSSEGTYEQVSAVNDKLVALTDDFGKGYGGFPRVVTSRSEERFGERQRSGDLNTGRLMTKNEVKIEIVGKAIDEILSRAEVRDDKDNDKNHKEKLRKCLDNLMENDW